MAYSEQTLRAVSDTLQRRRNRAAIRADEVKQQLLQSIPALAESQTEINRLGIDLLRFSLLDDRAAMDATQQKINELSSAQKNLLVQNGYSADSLDPKPFCAVCGDTGTLENGEPCACARALMRSYALAEITKVSPLALCSFDSFELKWYSAKVDLEYGTSARENAAQNLQKSREYAASFPCGGENLLMLGDAGLGKTHLALSIAGEVLDSGHDVIYCSAANIFKQIETEHFDGGHDTATLDNLKQCDLLVLDDIGAEFNSPFVTSVLYDLINTRINERRSTILTTNFTDENALMRRYGEKISSRLIGCCTLMPFFGEDIRIQKSAE